MISDNSNSATNNADHGDEDLKQRPAFKSKAIDLHLQCDDCKDFFKSKCKLSVHWNKVHMKTQFICQSCKQDFKSYTAYDRHKKNRPKRCLAALLFCIEGIGKRRIISQEIKAEDEQETDNNSVLDDTFQMSDDSSNDQKTLTPKLEDIDDKGINNLLDKSPMITDKSITATNNADHGDVNLLQDLKQKPVFKSRAIDLHLQCDDCKDFFKSKCKLRVHLKKVHKKTQFICQSCKQDFKSYTAYDRHKKNRPKRCLAASHFRIEGIGKRRIIYCKECNNSSSRMEVMISHRHTHTGEKPFTCDTCGESHTHLNSLVSHKESRHREYKVEITCQYCGKLIKGRDRAYKHLKVHTLPSMKCRICLKMFKNIITLNLHMVRHQGVKNVQCDLCQKNFFTTAALSNHKREVHFTYKHHICDLCGYQSARKRRIMYHRIKHDGSNISCVQCGKFFESAHKLSAHQLQHNAKNYVCQHCNREYYRKDNLRKHMMDKHLCKTTTTQSRPALEAKKEETNK